MSVSLSWVGDIRRTELARILTFLPPGCSILDFGAGGGQQARRLSELGFTVAAVDVESSHYLAQSVFPVRTYDGAALPFPDGHFDVVMSSNVLEHIADLPTALGELRRVLKPGGTMLHVLPTGSWRLWTTAAEFLAAPRNMLRGMLSGPFGRWEGMSRTRWAVAQLEWLLRPFRFRPHGERGNSLSEVWRFSRWSWRRQFVANRWLVQDIVPLKLWYTGESVLGPRLSLAWRTRMAALLGSATILYVIRDSVSRDVT